MSDVISVRVKRQLKEKAEELGIDIRQVVEKALGEEIKKREEEEIRKSAEIIVENMKEVKIQEWIKLVRETRDER
ncbi:MULTISPECIES: type II toxin-antitoxin system CcdA family antitoxin [Metallosphaera]|uniref:type II toxin-antitoxin system CcdA family antitoxin n=1 Tax=Metallosphaera TaxID=41980 RepID=UPI001EE1155E|nr:type II toxin-antitoxin system CcdA family antitoxin [Metallosphaera javensis (ex Hofmann et al. 2022)]